MQSAKRKNGTPSWATPSPGPSGGASASGRGSSVGSVKHEDGQGEGDYKRQRMNAPSKPPQHLSASHGMYADPRTAAIDLCHQLKRQMTMSYHEAFYRVQDTSPGLDATQTLELLKSMERVEFKAINEVFHYIPELTLSTIPELRTYIRVNSTQSTGIPIKTLRDAMPQGSGGIEPLKELEQKGDILIMRALTGIWKDIPLPRLGRANVNGMKITDGGNGRWKMVFWDHLREAGKASNRVDDEFIFSWADVPMAETDDVMKLLADQELSASSAVPIAPKVVASANTKKKKKTTRALKITNTHMKEQGIDFSKDYERPS